MCFKLDNGSELFSVQDMQRLKKPASGRMGSRAWVLSLPPDGGSVPAPSLPALDDESDRAPADTLRVEMPAAVLLRLLCGGHLGAADLQCLDRQSRARLRRLCLDSCKPEARPRTAQSRRSREHELPALGSRM